MKRSSAMNRFVIRILLVAVVCSISGFASASTPQFAYQRFTIPGDGRIAGNGINNVGVVAGVVDDFGTSSLRRSGFVRHGTAVPLSVILIIFFRR